VVQVIQPRAETRCRRDGSNAIGFEFDDLDEKSVWAICQSRSPGAVASRAERVGADSTASCFTMACCCPQREAKPWSVVVACRSPPPWRHAILHLDSQPIIWVGLVDFRTSSCEPTSALGYVCDKGHPRPRSSLSNATRSCSRSRRGQGFLMNVPTWTTTETRDDMG